MATKNNVKKRVSRGKKAAKKNVLLIPFILMAIAIMLLVYLMLGIDFTILTGLILAIILLLISMLNNIRNNKRRKKLISFVLIVILTLAILGVAGFCAFIIYIKTIADPRFKVSKLNTPEITILYDKDDKMITKLGSEQREKVNYDELPEVLVDAIVATEDSRFFQHNGFDAPRFLKASIGQVMGNADAGGASTLSMQVVKNSFTDAKIDSGVAGIIRKFEDIYLSVYKLEKKYTKEEIIEYYVNNHFLGGNIYGVEEAAQTYFGKSVSDLNLSEAATIAGMFKSPNFYRPNANPKNATARRASVLYLMKRHGYITEEQERMANAIPMESLTQENVKKDSKYQGYIDTVVEEIKDTYGVNPYTTSLKIYTNLDRKKQDAVDRVLSGKAYTWKDKKLDTGVAVLNVETGAVQAIGAGRHRSKAASTWNNATDIKRQPGSTAKPLFDYGPGIEFNDWSTGKMFNDAPYSYSNGTPIHNWDNGYYGNITLRRALSASRNIPALKAFQQVDNKKVIEFVQSLGIEPEIENGYIHEAHAIGAFTGVNPLQMAAAYSAFANGGYYNKPYSVRKIEFRLSGKVEEHKKDRKKVMSDATAFMIADVLQDVNLNGGTPYNVAVKTGTTNFDEATKAKYGLPGDAIRDSWAIGFSTKTAIGMWYGYDSIDKNYVSHNIPASIAKDHEFIALVNAGAMESNRGTFKQPNSVLKAGGEYYKKGTKPPKTEAPSALQAPGNLRVSYNPSSQTLSLSWGAVKRVKDDSSYGEFGYRIYRNGALIGWTTGTSYSISTSEPSGTYKVQAGYKGYSGIQAGSATNKFTYKVEEPDPEPEPEPEPETP
ncbi:MAG: transglycosylase domain-containing protein [Bacilli bacterium]|nr:transglycosylase domain-containing protein [Bacilli bacterium]